MYTGDIDATETEILDKARQRFSIVLPKPVEFVYLRTRKWVEAKKYPVFTLLGQSFGSLILGKQKVALFDLNHFSPANNIVRYLWHDPSHAVMFITIFSIHKYQK